MLLVTMNKIKNMFSINNDGQNFAAVMPNIDMSIYGDSMVIPNKDKVFGVEEDIIDVIDKKIRTKYSSGFIKKVRKKPVTEVVLHGTMGGDSVAGLLTWMYNGGRDKEYKKGIALFHYLIGRGSKKEKDGLIAEVIDPLYYVYHSTSSSNDKQTIGIELINSSKSNRNPYTKGQYDSLFKLIFDHLLILYPSINRITSHRYNIWRWNNKFLAKRRDKNCPGNFDWHKLDNELMKRGYEFLTDGNLRYNIRKA